MLRELNVNEMEFVSGGGDTTADTIHGSHDPLGAGSNPTATGMTLEQENQLITGLYDSGMVPEGYTVRLEPPIGQQADSTDGTPLLEIDEEEWCALLEDTVGDIPVIGDFIVYLIDQNFGC